MEQAQASREVLAEHRHIAALARSFRGSANFWRVAAGEQEGRMRDILLEAGWPAEMAKVEP